MTRTSDPVADFKERCAAEIERLGTDRILRNLTTGWLSAANALNYSYHFSSLGRPIIQYPQDMIAVQEIIWSVKPTVVIETGIAHGGSLIHSAHMLATLDYAEAVAAKRPLDPLASSRRVVGIDIDIREHNRSALDGHPLRHKLTLIEGSSIEPTIVAKVKELVKPNDIVLVILDSNHTHDHVLQELRAYAPLTSPGSYCIVFDTIIEHLPSGSFPNRPWDIGDNPRTAITEYLMSAADDLTGFDGRPLQFNVDTSIDKKLLISVAPGGYLRRVEH